jgi:hypothetical protein
LAHKEGKRHQRDGKTGRRHHVIMGRAAPMPRGTVQRRQELVMRILRCIVLSAALLLAASVVVAQRPDATHEQAEADLTIK